MNETTNKQAKEQTYIHNNNDRLHFILTGQRFCSVVFLVTSWVVDVVLQTGEKRNLNISGLKKPVHLYIPQNSGNGSPADVTKNTVQYFVKPSYNIYESKLIQYHKINIPDQGDMVSVKLHPEKYATSLRVYVSSSDFPTPREHNFSIVLPCKIEEQKCNKDPYVFSFNTSDTGNNGIHYIGIHYYVNITNDVMFQDEEALISVNGSVQERPRRSIDCDRSRRQKRSCIGVKDPPPPPTPAPIVLRSEYNASTDLNYTLFVTIGSCFYWSEVKEQWTDEGCKVRPALVYIYKYSLGEPKFAQGFRLGLITSKYWFLSSEGFFRAVTR